MKNLFKLIDFLIITNLNSIFYKLKKSNFFDYFILKKIQYKMESQKKIKYNRDDEIFID